MSAHSEELFVYVVKSQKGNYYVGLVQNVLQALGHLAKTSRQLIEVTPGDKMAKTEKKLELMKKYGADKVFSTSAGSFITHMPSIPTASATCTFCYQIHDSDKCPLVSKTLVQQIAKESDSDYDDWNSDSCSYKTHPAEKKKLVSETSPEKEEEESVCQECEDAIDHAYFTCAECPATYKMHEKCAYWIAKTSYCSACYWDKKMSDILAQVTAPPCCACSDGVPLTDLEDGMVIICTRCNNLAHDHCARAFKGEMYCKLCNLKVSEQE